MIVLLGAHDLADHYQTGTISLSPSKIVIHPHWNPFVLRFDADLAIVFIEDQFSFTDNIIPICMFKPKQDLEEDEGVIVGFGQSEDKSKTHETMPRKLTVPVKPNEECFLDNHEFAKISSNRTFCAGPKNGMGACRGNFQNF